MNILIIDGQGGGIGKQLIGEIKNSLPASVVTAVGTNSAATAAMLKAGADFAATGENSVCVACKNADIIAGPIAIVIADSLLGEITPRIAIAVGRSHATKYLIPVNQCNNIIVGIFELTISKLIKSAVEEIKRSCVFCHDMA